MNTALNRALAALIGLFLLAGGAAAEDVDIYAGVQLNGPKPNMLILLDNSAAWDASVGFTCTTSDAWQVPSNNAGKAVGFEQCALHKAALAIGSSPSLVGNINLGLMLFGSGSTNGGQFVYPAAAPYALPTMTTSGVASYITALDAVDRNGNKSNGAAVGATMQEAWAYYSGNTGLSGTHYTSPITSACQKNFVVYIANANNMGKPQDQGQTASDALVAAGASSTQLQTIQIPLPYNKYQANEGDEWARYMYQTDLSGAFADQQNIVTYTIAVTDGSNPDYVSFLKSMASNGGGKAFVVSLGDMNGLVQALLSIFNELQAVNSVFASSSLPVSVNAQGTYLNQIYMGMFRPDASANPRWMGNLKQYQLGVDNSNPASPQLYLADSLAKPALNSAGTGFLSPNAISFWTSINKAALPDSMGGFWVNDQQGAGNGYDSPDGEVVEKGGVGQQIRLANLTDNYTTNPTGPRNMYTCVGGCLSGNPLSNMPFATSNANITAALLGTGAPPMAIASITRVGLTATVTLSSAPSPALANGQSVAIAGSKYPELNGSFNVTPTGATTFTYTIVAEDPPTPAQGSYSVTKPSNPQSVALLTRAGTTVTAAVNGHGYVNGQNVTISGATGAGYNGTFAVTVTDVNHFTYMLSDGSTPPATQVGPATPGSGGTATVGSTTGTIAAGGIVRVITTSNSSNVVPVTVTTTGNISSFAAGNTVTISGATPIDYNGSWSITATGKNCPGGTNNKSFCFNINTTPASPDPSFNIKADGGAAPVAISSLTHTASNCPTTANATVTATTASAHGFGTGETVSIGGTPGAGENAYVGSFLVTVVDSTHFTYPITTSPGCSDSTAGMTASVQAISRNALINWVRGDDIVGDEPSPGNGITVRPSVHGDVVHSRPAVIDYGTGGVVVFYGANDGTFRAINGNKSGNIGGVPPGGELWSFVPVEFYSKLARLYANSPVIKLFSTPPGITPTPQPKDYYFDGSTGLYQNPSTGKAYIFLSARRGGRLLYALDVSNPSNPIFMWNHTSADAGFTELGYTWSSPRVAMVKGYANPVLIFGAGYDLNEDSEPPAADTMGRGLFVLDAITGNIVWRAAGGSGSNSCSNTPCLLKDMTYAIPADVALVDRNGDGYIDRLYAADTGGNLWRVDLEPNGGNAPSNWQANKLASLGGSGTTPRKFFYPPDFLPGKLYDMVLAGTGDREHPVYGNQSLSIVNRFYMLKDLTIGMDASGSTPIVDATSSTADAQPPSLFNATSIAYDGSLSGFYLTLVNPGEKVVNAATSIGGTTYFGTNQPVAPNPNACQGNLGIARGYQLNFMTGAESNVQFQGGGLPPSPVTGLVSIMIGGVPRLIPFLLGGGNPNGTTADSKSALGAQVPPITISGKRHRTFWYRQHDK